jgi:hypothetical protein
MSQVQQIDDMGRAKTTVPSYATARADNRAGKSGYAYLPQLRDDVGVRDHRQ